MRYWKTASARTCPGRIYGRKAAGNSSSTMGNGRGDAVLENSICPDSPRKDLRTQSGRKFFQYMGAGRGDAVLE